MNIITQPYDLTQATDPTSNPPPYSTVIPETQPSRPWAKTLRFIELDTGYDEHGSGCWVPIERGLNPDGYYRKTWATQDKRYETEMFHRFIFRAHHNLKEIPKSHEVDHACGTRCCQNPNHLQLLPRAVHLSNTNRERYNRRMTAAHLYWKQMKCTGTALGEMFGVSPSNACRWVRMWKAEEAMRLAH